MQGIQTATAGPSQRDKMICQHLPLVRSVVRKMLIEVPNGAADAEDLVGHGTIGLIQAVDRFDNSLGTPFAGFAVRRIRGAVFDALRTLDPRPDRPATRRRSSPTAAREKLRDNTSWPATSESSVIMCSIRDTRV